MNIPPFSLHLSGGVRHVERLRGSHAGGHEGQQDEFDRQLSATEHVSGRAAQSLQQHRRGGECKAHPR